MFHSQKMENNKHARLFATHLGRLKLPRYFGVSDDDSDRIMKLRLEDSKLED